MAPEYFSKIRFLFGSSSFNVGFGSGSSSMELERYFRGGHLLGLTVTVRTS